MSAIPSFDTHLIFFDQAQFRSKLDDGSIIKAFKDAITAVDHNFDQRFLEGESIRTLVQERAIFIDCMLHYAWHKFDWSTDVSLIAVGGYGRGELHPKSDVDLLILLNNTPESSTEKTIEKFLTLLWDIGLDIGHSVRTLEQCISIAKDDVTVFTNLLEARLLQGSQSLELDLEDSIALDKMWDGKAFFDAKMEEQMARHKKHNNTEYNLEPNIKNAPGGLRDIQTIKWLIKRTFNLANLNNIEKTDVFTDGEYAILMGGEEVLWKVRYGLHMIAKRPEERLLFDYQRELCTIFGYQDTAEQLAIEQFMQVYYRVVLALRELNDVILQFINETIFERHHHSTSSPINERFQLHNQTIEITRPDVFKETPSALLELFVIVDDNPEITGIRASTIRMIRESRELINDEFRASPDNKALFLELFNAPNNLVMQLRRMLRYGILGRYLPEFGRIIGQMQHDLFHRYTVDGHTLNLIRFLGLFEQPEAAEDYPTAAKIIHRLEDRSLLYIAGLYHDIAKGRGGDHSSLGAIDARKFCESHGLSSKSTRLVAWLVENHLLMSAYSQKQDLSDPEVIHNFAMLVGDRQHLNYLYLLTVADMNATNPDIWNTWRASLMRDLFYETRRALRRGLENPIDRQESIQETQQAALYILADQQIDEAEIQTLWQCCGEDYFLREDAYDIAWHTPAIIQQVDEEQPLILIRDKVLQGNELATQIFLRMREKPHVFAAVISSLNQLGLIVQDARIYSTQTGFTMDTFFVLDEHHQPVNLSDEVISKIRSSMLEELNLVDNYSDIISKRLPRVLKYFSSPTRTNISTDITNSYSILEVISPDRPGLLSRLSRIFVEFGIAIINAKIITLGERVEDLFFITTQEGLPLTDLELCRKLQETICKELDAQTTDAL